MANDAIQAQAAPVIPTFQNLYVAYEAAEAALYGAIDAYNAMDSDLPEDMELRLCEAHVAAINALMLHPAKSASELSTKLRVYHRQALHEGWNAGDAVSKALAADAARVASRDAFLMASFASYMAARQKVDSVPADGPTSDDEKAGWAAADEAERVMVSLPASSPQGAQAKLWLALLHTVDDRAVERLVLAQDLKALQAMSEQLELSARLMIDAVAALEGMAAV
jgi:hypothetical protein